MARYSSVTATELTPEEVAKDEEHVRRTLSQSPHIVGIPRAAERYIHPEPKSLAHQLSLQVATNAVEHLEFERIARDSVRRNEAFHLFDHRLVMRRDSRIHALLQQQFGELEEIAIHVALVGKGHRGRLQIRALAEADAD